MSISSSEKTTTVKKSISHHHRHHHRRNKSGDLDLLEAARYFSSAGIAENRSGGGRMSLDVPVRSLLTQETPSTVMKHQQQVNSNKEKKKHPKPSSPGARLTTFLNSIFSHNNNAEKKKKKKAKSIKDHEDDEVESCRRRPRSSVRCSSTSSDAMIRDHGDQIRDSRHNAMDLSWLDEKLKLIENSTTHEKQKRLDDQSQRKESVSVEVLIDDHADESDCSSDLFELENCDLGLPVYETTNMDNFKRPGSSIAAAAAPPL